MLDIIFMAIYATIGAVLAPSIVIWLQKNEKNLEGDWLLATIIGICLSVVWPLTIFSICTIGNIKEPDSDRREGGRNEH